MKSRKYTLSAATLALAAAFALVIAAPGAVQAKEGTWSDTFAGFGNFKETPVGKERLLIAIEENGLTVSSDPMFDRMTYHCLGLEEVMKGTHQAHGDCVATDPAGDQIVESFDTEKFSLSQKSFKGSLTLRGGTGKFAGISGTGTYEYDGLSFRPTEKDTFFDHGTRHFSYKLP